VSRIVKHELAAVLQTFGHEQESHVRVGGSAPRVIPLQAALRSLSVGSRHQQARKIGQFGRE
jgi:hypothetical protein